VRISDEGVNLIKSFEGLSLTAYRCSAQVLTIGYGHTGPDVQPDSVIDEPTAEAYLRKDLETAETCVNACVAVPVTQGQFDALCSFAFNLGCKALRKSTLLKCLNAGDDEGAANEFPKWNRASGKVLQGLARRREAEKELFLS
jgi:lysozyme